MRNGLKYKTLDRVKYLFLTETRDTIKQSKQNKNKDDFPLALSLFDLTNQLWIKTNKGLGNGNLPATFDIRTQATIALSASLAKKVTKEYDKLSEQHKDKNIDKESFINNVADLRKKELLPDDIVESNCEEIASLIVDCNSMERHYAEKAHHQEESKRKGQVIQSRDLELEEQAQEINRLKKIDIDRKSKNKKTIKIIAFLIVICSLFYFRDAIIDAIPFWDLGRVIFYASSALTIILTILTFLGINRHKIKSYFLKK